MLLVLGLALAVGVAALIWGGPLMSGALFLAWPPSAHPSAHDLSAYVPLHKGYADLQTGLYVREDDDLVLAGPMPFVMRRTYRTNDRRSRPFGVGATSNADWYLVGDGVRFQFVELILADGGRIHYDRTSSGTSYQTARFAHWQTPTIFYGSQIGWTGFGWVLRFLDGSIANIQACSPDGRGVCGLVRLRDADGHVITFTRDREGLLRSIDNGSERASFQYDDRRRIRVIRQHGLDRMRYVYDAGGRLTRATAADGTVRTYTYGPDDEMLTVREPGRGVDNTYNADGRLIHQVFHRDGLPDDIETIAYRTNGESVLETETTDNNGRHEVERFDDHGNLAVDIVERAGKAPVLLSYDHTRGEFLESLTIRCVKNGRRVAETIPPTAAYGNDDLMDAVIGWFCD
jgi:YD repeat-containing protein